MTTTLQTASVIPAQTQRPFSLGRYLLSERDKAQLDAEQWEAEARAREVRAAELEAELAAAKAAAERQLDGLKVSV